MNLSGGYGDSLGFRFLVSSGFSQEGRNNLKSLKQRKFNSDNWLTGEGEAEKADGGY